MKKLKLKLLAILGVITMLIGLFPMPISAQPKIPTLTFTVPYPMSSNKNDKWTIGIDRMTNVGTDYACYAKLYIDNKLVRCNQLSIAAIANSTYSVDSLDTKGYPKALQTKLKDIEAFGYGMNNDKSDEMNFATSIRIWQELNAFDSKRNAKPSHIHPDIQKKIDVINQRLAIKEKRVSFENETINLIGYGEKYAITLQDTQQVFQHYVNTSTSGISFKRNGNSIKVWAERSDKQSGSLSFQLFPTNKSDVALAYSSINESQDVMYLSGANPKTLNIHYRVDEGEVTLHKEDVETKKVAQGDASLYKEGAYTLYYAKDVIINNQIVHKANEIVSEQAIGSDLSITWKNLICADYYIQESKAPTGYLLDQSKHHFTIDKDHKEAKVLSKEQVKKQGAEIVKISTNGEGSEVLYLEGVEFSGKLLSEVNEKGKDNAKVVSKVITDKNGYAKIPELPYGVYIFYETKTPEGYLCAQPFIIEINEDSREPLPVIVVNNAPFEAYIRGVKHNGATNQSITLTSAVFELYDSDGKLVTFKLGDKEVSKLETDERGVFSTPLKIKSGVYTIKEIQTPKGFIKLDTPISVTVSNDTITYDEKGDAFVDIVIKNERPVGELALKKTFEHNENLKQPLEAGFEVRVATPILDPTDGKVAYDAGTIIKNKEREDGLFMIKDNETIVIDNLPIGTSGSSFIVSEKYVPEGYNKIKDFTIDFTIQDDTTKTYSIYKEIENETIKTNVEFLKTNAYTKEVILDETFQFAMYEDEECTKLVETKEADIKNGKVVFNDIAYGSTYYFKEIMPPLNYYLSEEVIAITFDHTLENIGNTIQIEYDNTPIPNISTLAKGKKDQKIFDPAKNNIILDVTDTFDFNPALEYDRTTQLIHKKDDKVVFTFEDKIAFDTKDAQSIVELKIAANTIKEDGEYYIAQFYYERESKELYLTHKDANDQNQSIKFQTKQMPKTHDTTNTEGFLSLIGLSLIVITSTLYWKQKKH